MTQFIRWPTYMDAIHKNYPLVQAACEDDGSVYENIYLLNAYDPAHAPMPAKVDLEPIRLAMAQYKMSEKIGRERDRRKSNGILVGTDWFHSDDPSRIQQIGLVMFGANMPPGIMWKTRTATFVPMTPPLAMQLFQTNAHSDGVLFKYAEVLRQQMMLAADPTTFDYTVGWPKTFGE